MKKYFMVTIAFLLFSLPFYSQKNIVKFGFLHNGGTNYGFTYERSIASNFSLLAQWGFVTDIIFDTDNAESFQVGSGLYLEGRYYFQKEKDLMEGWHVGVNFLFQDTEMEDDFSTEYLKRKGFGVTTGYQWIFLNHLTIDTMFGLGYSINSTNIKNLDNGVIFILGANLGYNF
ncbi:DUF3575 domain-containing protein [Namhaeicola litoreus]|uniref:DUF3575 domain-containing protein n=1 Tax=Namhaeicola litoreus TaxID=1052145 RepID=A0ABW3XZY5_9FLAO